MRTLIFCLLASMTLFPGIPVPAKHWYMGLPVPGAAPRLFAPGRVSTGLPERDIAISPDGREICFGILSSAVATIAVTRFEQGRWTDPEVAPFSRNPDFKDLEPCFSADGQRLLFLSTRPPAGEAPRRGWGHQNIWMVERGTDGGWGEPGMLPKAINNGEWNYFPSLSRDGTLYFTRCKRGARNPALFRSRLVKGQYQEPERLPDTVNAAPAQFNACVSPDGSILVFCALASPGTPGRVDYVACFQNPEGSWTKPVTLGSAVNGPEGDASSPAFSPDGKFFFFSAARLRKDLAQSPKPVKLSELLKVHEGPENGESDIYWISASVLESSRPR